MKNLIFACYLGSAESEKEILRLARSIRTFGGEFCFNPIWLLSRRTSEELSTSTQYEINSLGARLVPFEVNRPIQDFPFGSYVTAAGIAESLAQGQASFLTMMASDTLVLQPPYDFLLPVGKSLGACPVHLKLLGSGSLEPLDDFWQLIYNGCKVDMQQVFEMQTVVDEQSVRAYLNAGLLVVRPERGLLRTWQSNFESLYQQPEFESFYQLNDLYPIFMHQAVLAGSLLASIKPDEFLELPFEVNYPLHLHSQVRQNKRPGDLTDLVTCRYEDFNKVFTDPKLDEQIQIETTLRKWIDAELQLSAA
jgi:hypothetical protein